MRYIDVTDWDYSLYLKQHIASVSQTNSMRQLIMLVLSDNKFSCTKYWLLQKVKKDRLRLLKCYICVTQVPATRLLNVCVVTTRFELISMVLKTSDRFVELLALNIEPSNLIFCLFRLCYALPYSNTVFPLFWFVSR